MATSRKEWTDEDVRAEIREAVRIVSEDREKAEYTRLHGKYGDKPEGGEGGAQPPPKKEGDGKPEGGDPPKRKSLWWGDEE